MAELVVLIGLIAGYVVAGGVAIYIAWGARELVRTALEFAALSGVVVLIGLALSLMSGAIRF